MIEKGAGISAGFSDQTYKDAGVTVAASAAALTKASDVVIKVRPPSKAEAKRFFGKG